MAYALRALAQDSLDAVSAVANGRSLALAAAGLKPAGRLVFSHGVQPEPAVPDGRRAIGHDGDMLRSVFDVLNALIG